MHTNELFTKKTVFSFEVFPPKRDTPIESVYPTLDELSKIRPDFISVTCGAGGQGSNRTTEVATYIKNLGCETVAHMPCIYLTEEEALETLEELKARGIENILALRGDETPGRERSHRFEHASDLIAFIKEKSRNSTSLAPAIPKAMPKPRPSLPTSETSRPRSMPVPAN